MRVVVAFGGRSVEHDISIISAMQLMKTMLCDYQIIACYVDYDGNMFACPISQISDKQALFKDLKPVEMHKSNYEYYFVVDHKKRKKWLFDFVIPMFHGTNGEDGCFQGMLQFLNIPYGFSNPLSLACIQDKEMMKHLLQEANIATLRWFVLYEYEVINQKIYDKIQRLGYPIIIKAAHLGSSIGIKIVTKKEQLLDALSEIFQYDHKVIIEPYLETKKEYHMAIFHDYHSKIEEIVCEKYYSFENKYQKDQVKKVLPANINEEKELEMKYYAKECLRIFQIDSMVRIDFIEDEQGNLYVNEINGIPGSCAYQLWEASGIPLSKMIELIIIDGMRRYRKNASKQYQFHHELLLDGIKIK